MQFVIKIADEEKVIRVLDGISDRAADLHEPLADFGERMVRKISKRLSGDALDVNTGRLRNSLTYAETEGGLEISAGGGPGEVDYAAIHHYGGVIKPKNKKFLTIPFPGGRQIRRYLKGQRILKIRLLQKGIIFQSLEHESVPLFILKKSVTIPARPYMYLEDSDVEYLNNSIAEHITQGA